MIGPVSRAIGRDTLSLFSGTPVTLHQRQRRSLCAGICLRSRNPSNITASLADVRDLLRVHEWFQLWCVFLEDTTRTSEGQMLQPGTSSQWLSINLVPRGISPLPPLSLRKTLVQAGHVSARIWKVHQMCIRGWVAM